MGRRLHREGRRRRAHRHGVTPVDGLDGAGKVVYGPDLSFESQSPNLTNLDTNGHGTFMAGLIAAKSPRLPRDGARRADRVSVKVGVADGGTDVSQVIAAIDWVVQHRNDNDLNIRIINLSYGTNSAQDYRVDPLAYAAERAWKAGIVVVAAGGNYGFQSHMNNAPALADPAIDPYVIAVGSSDSNGHAHAARRQGPGLLAVAEAGSDPERRPDRPRRPHPGSAGPELVHRPEPSRKAGSAADYFRGSGTSESAAIVSGAAALVLQKHPARRRTRSRSSSTTHGARHQREGPGHRRRRAADATNLSLGMPSCDPDLGRPRTGPGSLDAVARHRPRHARWRRR